MNAAELEQSLRQFTGSTEYAQIFGNVLLTQGARYLAEEAQCFWLMDVYGSYLMHINGDREPFTCLKLKKTGNSARVVIEDGNDKQIAKQDIEYTDFPLTNITLYGCWSGDCWVVMLTSEY